MSDHVHFAATMEAEHETENENERPLAPLPTKEIARRRTVEQQQRRPHRDLRRTTQESLATFTSQTSFGSDPSKIVEVGNLRFLSDNDMPDGRSSILGKGAFALVRLARRVHCERSASMVSNLTDVADFGGSEEKLNLSASDRLNLSASDRGDEGGALVAVKIFEKSTLQKCRTVERDAMNQMQVRTAYEKVEREIAVMKKLRHPNLVSLIEVVDTGSNRLYMVLEYLPLGEIMTNVPGTGRYERKPTRNGGGRQPPLGVTVDGHFDERHAALYFVDVMHGLAHLHKNHIVHRDLKPENILLDSRGVAKIGDLGVSHLFEDETSSITSLGLDNLAVHDEMRSAKISRSESEAALTMKSMADEGKLTRTEGTWAFWSPEMCGEDSLVFSGYSCDMWAAGVCLYVFATGRLPFYSEAPMALFDMIAAADVELDGAGLSDALVGLLGRVLARDPGARAGVGDCLRHQFCDDAREQRLRELGEDVEKSEEVVVRSGDVQRAFTRTQKVSLKALTSGLKKQLSRLPAAGSLTPPKSAGADGVDGRARGSFLWGNKSAPNLPAWRRSRNTFGTAGLEGEESTGESDDASRKRRYSLFARSSALFRQRGRSE